MDVTLYLDVWFVIYGGGRGGKATDFEIHGLTKAKKRTRI